MGPDAGFERREIQPLPHGRMRMLEQTMASALHDPTPEA
jgi:hypothetical protein